MREFWQFQWLCLREAWKGSFVAANAWSGLWGPILVWVASYAGGHPVKLPEQLDGYALLLVLAFFGATWIAIFIVRLVGAPARLYWTLHRTVPGPRVPDLSLEVDTDLAFETYVRDENGKEVPPAQTFSIRVRNISNQTIYGCQLFLTMGQQDYPVSKPFDLRPGEPRDLPFIRVHPEHARDRRAFIYLLSPDCEIAEGAPALLLRPAIYVAKILSNDAPPLTQEVRLEASSDFTSAQPREWTLRAAH